MKIAGLEGKNLNLIFIGVGLSFLVWILDPIVDTFLFGQGQLVQQFVSPEPVEVYFRTLVSVLIILFSIYAEALIKRRRSLEKELQLSYDELQNTYGAMEKAQASAVTAEKMAALGRLTAGATHEILNPLNIIKIILHMEIENPDVPKIAAEELRKAMGQVDRIGQVVKGLVQFSSQQPLESRLIDINDVVRNALGLLDFELKLQDVALELRLSEELPLVLADRDQLQRVVLNLLINARDAMPEGGRLVVTTDAVQAGEGLCVEIRVEDTGEGIDVEDMDKIFEPFFTTKPLGEGTGLGVSICRGIVEAHGGTIRCESVKGEGTTFIVKLPRDKKEKNVA